MSKLRTPSGDDHPDAAHKHLLDAKVLLEAQRADGAAYLSGYVVECALKSLWLFETGVPSDKRLPWGKTHHLNRLADSIATMSSVAGAKTARYFKAATRGLPTSPIAAWSPEMRYRSPCMSLGDASTWLNTAEVVFLETVAQMQLDGVI
jgi:HEPN domain-containing protein